MKWFNFNRKSKAFSLVELSTTIAVVGVLMSGAIVGLQNSANARKYETNNKQMQEIDRSLKVYFTVNNVLPYPSDPSSSTGLEDAAIINKGYGFKNNDSTAIIWGTLPFKTLGLPDSYGLDPWGNKREYIVFSGTNIPNGATIVGNYTKVGYDKVKDAKPSQISARNEDAQTLYGLYGKDPSNNKIYRFAYNTKINSKTGQEIPNSKNNIAYVVMTKGEKGICTWNKDGKRLNENSSYTLNADVLETNNKYNCWRYWYGNQPLSSSGMPVTSNQISNSGTYFYDNTATSAHIPIAPYVMPNTTILWGTPEQLFNSASAIDFYAKSGRASQAILNDGSIAMENPLKSPSPMVFSLEARDYVPKAYIDGWQMITDLATASDLKKIFQDDKINLSINSYGNILISFSDNGNFEYTAVKYSDYDENGQAKTSNLSTSSFTTFIGKCENGNSIILGNDLCTLGNNSTFRIDKTYHGQIFLTILNKTLELEWKFLLHTFSNDQLNLQFISKKQYKWIVADERLKDTGVAEGTYGANNKIPKITVDKKGRITKIEELDTTTHIQGLIDTSLASDNINDLELIRAEIAKKTLDYIPIGTIIAYPSTTIPEGWLPCDGRGLSATIYPDLQKLLGANNLPDLRGVFIRGFDNGRGLDPARVITSYQADTVGSHNHELKYKSSWVHDSGTANSRVFITDPALIHNNAQTGGTRYYTESNSPNNLLQETRPKNVALNYIIFAKRPLATVSKALQVYSYISGDFYSTQDLVIKDGKLYQANDNIPAGTIFVVGTTGKTWRLISGGGDSSSSSSSIIYDDVPVGTVVAFYGHRIPEGWISLIPSQTLSPQDYPELAIALTHPGTSQYSSSDILLTGLGGRFIRGMDSTRTLGSWQQDAIQNITGTFNLSTKEWHNISRSNATGVFEIRSGAAVISADMGSSTLGASVLFDASRVVRTSTETRPENVALNYIIKVKSLSRTVSDAAAKSDYRLKEDYSKIKNPIWKILSLNPIKYKWKSSKEDDEGFLAHEVQNIVPSAVIGAKDAVDSNGNILPQKLKYEKIVPLLTAGIKKIILSISLIYFIILILILSIFYLFGLIKKLNKKIENIEKNAKI